MTSYTVREKCQPTYVFKHPETEIMMLAAYAKVRTTDPSGLVVLDCRDTDLFVKAVYVSQQIRGDLLIKH